MHYKLHGKIASIIILASFVLAATAVYLYGSLLLAILYCVCLAFSLTAIVAAYCRKCYQKNKDCVHFNLGKLSHFMPTPQNGKYTVLEYSVTIAAVLLILGFPQYWLVQNQSILAAYWLLTLGAVCEILVFVCRACKNRLCAFCRCEQA